MEFIKYMLPAGGAESHSHQRIIDGHLAEHLRRPGRTPENSRCLVSSSQYCRMPPYPRPVSPKYTDVSDIIQRHVFQALKKQVSTADALSGLETDLQKIVKS